MVEWPSLYWFLIMTNCYWNLFKHHIISCCENLKKIGTTLPMHRTVRGFLTSPGILLLFFGDLIPRTLRIRGPCDILITVECRAVLDLLHWQYGIPNDRATFSTCHVTYSNTGVVCFWNCMTTSDMLCPGKNEFFCAIYPELVHRHGRRFDYFSTTSCGWKW